MTDEAMHNLQDVWRSDWEYMPISRRIPKVTRTSLSIDADALLLPLAATTPSGRTVWKNEREVMVSYVQMMLKDFDRIDVRRVRIVNHDELPNWRFQCAACGGIFTRSDNGETASVCHDCYTQMTGELPSDPDSSDEPIPEEPANEPTDEEIKEYRQETDKLQWEMDHPECRCPPRD